ncbi:hypothetical protein ADUPG1_010339 [Aduncisulcus paluster]|uniref:Uncharacterized protein n=1 Tax=Aduncisulcus paluster TaxID=2918883 RepID=A0ABQ5JUQ5_9EUKA|nr:hypothetical protein ADUPG1_010339 [Aduncisulcus paluster]
MSLLIDTEDIEETYRIFADDYSQLDDSGFFASLRSLGFPISKVACKELFDSISINPLGSSAKIVEYPVFYETVISLIKSRSFEDDLKVLFSRLAQTSVEDLLKVVIEDPEEIKEAKEDDKNDLDEGHETETSQNDDQDDKSVIGIPKSSPKLDYDTFSTPSIISISDLLQIASQVGVSPESAKSIMKEYGSSVKDVMQYEEFIEMYEHMKDKMSIFPSPKTSEK